MDNRVWEFKRERGEIPSTILPKIRYRGVFKVHWHKAMDDGIKRSSVRKLFISPHPDFVTFVNDPMESFPTNFLANNGTFTGSRHQLSLVVGIIIVLFCEDMSLEGLRVVGEFSSKSSIGSSIFIFCSLDSQTPFMFGLVIMP